MPRINVEERIWSDPRLETLSRVLGSQGAAIGELVRFWRFAQEAWLEHRLIDADLFKQHLCPSLVDCGFAEVRPDGVYCRGSEEAFAWIVQRKEAGRKGGLQTQAKLKRGSSTAQAVLKQTQASSSSSFSSSDSKEKKEHTPPPPQGGATAFDRFWMIYPKKVGKKAAKRAWERAKINGSIDRVLRAVEQQKTTDQWKAEGGRFIPNPATWLNQGRWDDEPVGAVVSPRTIIPRKRTEWDEQYDSWTKAQAEKFRDGGVK